MEERIEKRWIAERRMDVRILLGIYTRNDHILRISDTLRRMGHTIEVVYTDEYEVVCSYAGRKAYQLGYRGAARRYREEWKRRLWHLLDAFLPEKVLFINAPFTILPLMEMQALRRYLQQKCVPLICWCVDVCRGGKRELPFYALFDKIFVYEKSDVAYLCNYVHSGGM